MNKFTIVVNEEDSIDYVIVDEENSLEKFSLEVDKPRENSKVESLSNWDNLFSTLVCNLINFDLKNISVTSTSVGYNRRDFFGDTSTIIDRNYLPKK